jgi:hypothetical protein
MAENSNGPSPFEVENSLAALIRELSETVSAMRGADRDIEHCKKLNCLAENTIDELEMWGRAVGHLSWLASTHQDATQTTIDSLGMVGLMQGKLLTMTNALDELKWELNHAYDKKNNKMLSTDLSIS